MTKGDVVNTRSLLKVGFQHWLSLPRRLHPHICAPQQWVRDMNVALLVQCSRYWRKKRKSSMPGLFSCIQTTRMTLLLWSRTRAQEMHQNGWQEADGRAKRRRFITAPIATTQLFALDSNHQHIVTGLLSVWQPALSGINMTVCCDCNVVCSCLGVAGIWGLVLPCVIVWHVVLQWFRNIIILLQHWLQHW